VDGAIERIETLVWHLMKDWEKREKEVSNQIHNSANTESGAISAYRNTSLCFTGTNNFIHNSANTEGGAIAADENTSVTFTRTSNFIHNSAGNKISELEVIVFV